MDPDAIDDGPETGPETGPGETLRAVVPEDRAGARLDRWLADALPGLSRSRIQALIREGQVRLQGGGTVSDASMRVKSGATVDVTLPPPEPAMPAPQDIPISVVFEDAHLIVIDKPVGMVVHPAPGNRDGTLVNALLHHCGDSLQGVGGVLRPGIVHRIDKDTSGLLVVAKTDTAHAGLSEQFAAHTIDRRYRALVLGVPEPLSGTIDRPIGRHPTDRIRFAPAREGSGKPAVTHYRVLAQSDMAAALIECRLETGRTHQIRVHMQSIGHPLIGDALYNRATKSRRSAPNAQKRALIQAFPRQALHAETLGFVHPVTGAAHHFTVDPPADFNSLCTGLEIAAPKNHLT